MKFIIWKLLRNNYSFLNIFLYIINITYIDINNKMKIKLKINLKQNDDLKMETECGEWKQNNKWGKFELKVSGACFWKMKFWLLMKLKIKMWMLKNLEMEMWLMVGMRFSKKI